MSGSENKDAPLVAVLDYGIGNLRSAQKALQRVGADARLTADPVFSTFGVLTFDFMAMGRFGDCQPLGWRRNASRYTCRAPGWSA